MAESLTLTSPVGGEDWLIGSTHNITWEHTDLTGQTLKIELSRNGVDYTSLYTGVAADDLSKSWTVTSPASVTCLIKISEEVDDNPTDTSPASFAISAQAISEGVGYAFSALIDDVGARLDIGNPSASTTPTEDQIKMWLNLAQLDIANKAIDYALNTLWAEQQIDGADFSDVESGFGGYWVMDISDDFLRPVEVQYWRASAEGGSLSRDRMYHVQLLNRDMALATLKNTLYAPTASRPIGWFWANKFYFMMGSAETKFSEDKMVISYVKEPALLEEDADVSDLPHVFQEYMVQFAVIQAKIQDTKMEEVPTLSALYEQGIQMINRQAAQSYYGLMGRR